MRPGAFLIAIWLFAATPAFAETGEEAYLAGRFLEAASICEDEGGADNLARAARSLLAHDVAAGKLEETSLIRAEKLARAALEVEPDHVEGRLQLAIALSMRSRLMSTREVLNSGYGKTGRDLARGVLEDDPSNVYAHGFLAVWNIEVVRKGGSLGAAWFGASLSDARTHFEAARRMDPDSPSLCWQYARALAAYDYSRYHDEIFETLTCALKADAGSAIDKLMQARARAFWIYARKHTRREIETQAAALL